LLIFCNTIRSMAEGELLQLERSYDTSVTEAHYFRVIERKSAALLAGASEVGAVLGGVTRAERRRLADYGREVGLAFQLRDDALDYEAREDALGKLPYTDIREGKVTLPLLLALKRCAPAERDPAGEVLKRAARLAHAGVDLANSPKDLDLKPVLEIVERYHGVADTVRRAEEHAERGIAAIAAFPDCEAKADLTSAAQYAVTRDR
jgi:octaprenyl-diphosphate synthase